MQRRLFQVGWFSMINSHKKGQVTLEFALMIFVSISIVLIISYSLLREKDSINSSLPTMSSSFVAESDARAFENSLYSGFEIHYQFSSNSSYRLEQGLMHYLINGRLIEIEGVFLDL